MKTHLFLSLLAPLPLASGAILFEDNFDRADSRNIDGSLAGISGSVGAGLASDSVYIQPHLDPANDPGPEDGDPANGGGARILNNELQLAVGSGTSNAFINHNFIDSSILAAGGLSVSLDITNYGGTARQNGGGFAIGMTELAALTAADAFDVVSPSMLGALNGPDPWGITGNPVAANIVSDFWIGIRGNNSLAWGSNTGNVQGLPANGIPTKTGTIAVDFLFPDFNAGTTVNYEVFYNGASQGTGSFQWSQTDANFIGLDGRSGTSVNFDNLIISTIPEPSTALLGAFGLIGLLHRKRN